MKEINDLRWMCNVSLRDKVTSVELRERMGIELVTGDRKSLEVARICVMER